MFLEGASFVLCGRLSESHEQLRVKIESFGGKYHSRVSGIVSHVICSEEAFRFQFDEVQRAKKKGAIIVRESFLLNCIKSRSLLNIHRGNNRRFAFFVPPPEVYLKTPQKNKDRAKGRTIQKIRGEKFTPVKKAQKIKTTITPPRKNKTRMSVALAKKNKIIKSVKKESFSSISKEKSSQIARRRFAADLDKNWYQYKDGNAFLNINIPLRSAQAKQPEIVFVVDNSSSMGSNGMGQVKKFVQSLLMRSNKNINPSFIIYNSSANIVSLETLLKTPPQGATSFQAAFEALNTWISNKIIAPGTEIQVVFMTDGHDNRSKNVQKAMSAFQQKARQKALSTTIHSIGFRPGHNVNFLEQIRNAGDKPGVYRYAENFSLQDKFGELFNFLETTVSTSVLVGNSRIEVSGYCDSEANVVSFNVLCKTSPEISFLCMRKLPFSVEVLGNMVEMEYKELDDLFYLQLADSVDIVSRDDLKKAKSILQDCPEVSSKKHDTIQMKKKLQNKLHQFEEMLPNTSGSFFARADNFDKRKDAKMNSLRFDAKLRENQRQRMEMLLRNT